MIGMINMRTLENPEKNYFLVFVHFTSSFTSFAALTTGEQYICYQMGTTTSTPKNKTGTKVVVKVSLANHVNLLAATSTHFYLDIIVFVAF